MQAGDVAPAAATHFHVAPIILFFVALKSLNLIKLFAVCRRCGGECSEQAARCT
jgi:hypothetical protein